jgi:hypothetical protein
VVTADLLIAEIQGTRIAVAAVHIGRYRTGGCCGVAILDDTLPQYAIALDVFVTGWDTVLDLVPETLAGFRITLVQATIKTVVAVLGRILALTSGLITRVKSASVIVIAIGVTCANGARRDIDRSHTLIWNHNLCRVRGVGDCCLIPRVRLDVFRCVGRDRVQGNVWSPIVERIRRKVRRSVSTGPFILSLVWDYVRQNVHSDGIRGAKIRSWGPTTTGRHNQKHREEPGSRNLKP